MSAEAPRNLRARGARRPSGADGDIRRRMANVRDAFRLRRLARDQGRLQGLYDEHSLFAESRIARCEMMRLLRAARSAWRLALGFGRQRAAEGQPSPPAV